MADLLARGRSILGRTEQEAAVKDYLKTGGVNLDPATKAWCASFVNATLKQEGLPVAGEAALSFRKYGDPVVTPRPGDIGVFARGDDPKHKGWEGHAGIATGQVDELGNPIILSGNANDMVMEHPISADRLIGWRRPPGMQEPAVAQPLLSPKEQIAVFTNRGRSNNLDQRMNPGPYSAVDRMGGTTTPQLGAVFQRIVDNEKFGNELLAAAEQNHFLSKQVAEELTQLHMMQPVAARNLLERFKSYSN